LSYKKCIHKGPSRHAELDIEPCEHRVAPIGARPRQQLAGYGEGADLIDMATAYTAGIVNSHTFVNDKKRRRFVVGILFLELNGYRLVWLREVGNG